MPSKMVSGTARDAAVQPQCTDDRGMLDTMLWDRTECVSDHKNLGYRTYVHTFIEMHCKDCDYRTGDNVAMRIHLQGWNGQCPVPLASEQEFEEMRVTLLNRVRDGN